MRIAVRLLLVALACGAPLEAAAETAELEYLLTLPEPFDPEKTYPGLLALPPGPQDVAMVEIADRTYWRHGQSRGWIVASPVAPGGKLFFDGPEKLIPSLLAELNGRYRIESDRFHVAGISNGGIAAFRVAENDPELFCSLLVLPGLPGNRADFDRLERLRKIPVDMIVGGEDARWATRMRETEERLREIGATVWLQVLPGVGHMISHSVSASYLFDRLEEKRPQCRAGAPSLTREK